MGRRLDWGRLIGAFFFAVLGLLFRFFFEPRPSEAAWCCSRALFKGCLRNVDRFQKGRQGPIQENTNKRLLTRSSETYRSCMRHLKEVKNLICGHSCDATDSSTQQTNMHKAHDLLVLPQFLHSLNCRRENWILWGCFWQLSIYWLEDEALQANGPYGGYTINGVGCKTQM